MQPHRQARLVERLLSCFSRTLKRAGNRSRRSNFCSTENAKQDSTTCVPSGRMPSTSRHSHRGRAGQRLRSHLCPLHPGSGKRGRPQLSPGGELASAGAHPSATRRPMEGPEREEPSGALPASDWQAHPLSYKTFPAPVHRRGRA
jgi:hypothetical protein